LHWWRFIHKVVFSLVAMPHSVVCLVCLAGVDTANTASTAGVLLVGP
jgi:hypothetical protein